MSDNSYILLKKIKSGYSITHADIEGGGVFSKYKTKGLLSAVKKTQKLQNEVNPEYGVVIHL